MHVDLVALLSWRLYMKTKRLVLAEAAVAITLSSSTYGIAADANRAGSEKVKHVLLLSIDGMHAVDFYNCSHEIEGANGGSPYCPKMAALSQTAINDVGTSSSKPSDSFPGTAACCWRYAEVDRVYYDVA
jgi:hypothetical protein